MKKLLLSFLIGVCLIATPTLAVETYRTFDELLDELLIIRLEQKLQESNLGGGYRTQRGPLTTDTSSSGSSGDPFTHPTHFGETVSATTSPIWINENLYVSSTAFLGSATTTMIEPTVNNTYNLGSFGKAWKNIYASSTAFLNYVSSTVIQVGSGSLASASIHNGSNSGIYWDTNRMVFTDGATYKLLIGNGILAYDNILPPTNEYNVSLGSFVAPWRNIYASTTAYLAGLTSAVNGVITLGTSTANTLVFNARVASDIDPNANNTIDLGSYGKAWKDVFVSGTLYADTALSKIPYYATSTAWTGTTTMLIGPAPAGMRFTKAYCETDTGTVNVSLYDGTNRANMITASTTIGTFNFSTNNIFTEAESIRIDFGTPVSSPKNVVCTMKYVF